MSNGKKQKSFFESPECEVRIACDGTALRHERIEKRVCARCEKSLERRGKSVEPRGVNYRERAERRREA
jgi:hypothetical protein